MVDVRERSEFGLYHLNGFINIPISNLRFKSRRDYPSKLAEIKNTIGSIEHGKILFKNRLIIDYSIFWKKLYLIFWIFFKLFIIDAIFITI